MPPNSAQAYIGKIANSLSNIANPFERQRLLGELTRGLNIRHLYSCEKAKVQAYSKNLSQRIQREASFYTMQQLGSPFPKIWESLRAPEDSSFPKIMST